MCGSAYRARNDRYLDGRCFPHPVRSAYHAVMALIVPRVFRWWFTVVWILIWLLSLVASLYLMLIIGLLDGDRELAREATVWLALFALFPWLALFLRWLRVRTVRQRLTGGSAAPSEKSTGSTV